MTERSEAKWNAAVERVNQQSDHLGYLYGRWQDEKEYEDWDNYKTAIVEAFSGFEITKIRKSPFEFVIVMDPGMPNMRVRVNSREISWKRVK
jgi:hypothetical protein